MSSFFQVDSLKEICEETLRKDIDNDTVLLCLGVAEQFSVSRLKVRTIEVPYSNYKLRSWPKVSLISFFLSRVFPLTGGTVKFCQLDLLTLRSQFFSLKFGRGAKVLGPRLILHLPASLDFSNACLGRLNSFVCSF